MRKLFALPVALVAVLLAVSAAGCGGSGGQAAAGDSASNKHLEAALKWARCMREHGVDVPDPKVSSNGLVQIGGPGGKGKPERTDLEASRSCEKYMREGAPAEKPSAAHMKEMQESALKFARCMREHGIDMPDPTFQGGGVTMQVTSRQTQAPVFKRAERECSRFLFKKDGSGPQTESRGE
ncbi:MAG TPA: hypothetical protein VGJ77_17215 [Gaiellaceae bacterium]|jgi:hypothetical protein